MDKKSDMEIPDYVIEGLARMILPKVIEFYESDEGKAFQEEYQKQHHCNDKPYDIE